jgi:hypothetical protein
VVNDPWQPHRNGGAAGSFGGDDRCRRAVERPARRWFCAGGHGVKEAGAELGSTCPAAGATELPELCGGAVVVVDRLVGGAGADLAGPVAVDRCRDVAKQPGTPLNWERMSRLATRWLPTAQIVRPWPSLGFDACTQGRSPVGLAARAVICAGVHPLGRSLLRPPGSAGARVTRAARPKAGTGQELGHSYDAAPVALRRSLRCDRRGGR